MSDSESDAIILRTENAVFRGKGPNISSAPNRNLQSSLASISKSKYANRNYNTNDNIFMEPSLPKRSNYFRRETSPQSMCSLREQTRLQYSLYPEPSLLQRSNYYRRETSPVSMCSLREPTRFQHSNGGLNSLRSLKNGRLGSPESVRSIESNISVTVREFLNTLHVLQNEKLSKLDMHLINNACSKFMKSKGKSIMRKKIEKRRCKLMLRKFRRNSENSSGDQASDSSLSSDESRVTTTKSLLSRGRDFIPYEQSSNDSRRKINNIKKNIKYSDLFKDCTDNIKSSSLRNISNRHMSERREETENVLQKDESKNRFLLPSLRFNKSKDFRTITQEKSDKPDGNSSKENNLLMSKPVEESESEEIFSNTDVNHMNSKENPSLKTNITSVDIHSTGDEKRTILTTHKKNSSNIQKNKENDFVFPVPEFPTKKRPAVNPKETLISKSAQPFNGTIQPELIINNTNVTSKLNDNSKKAEEQLEITQDNTNNISMKQSFMKRKLFTQTLDITETKNMSSDDINTPQANLYSEKQKHKIRKLVTSQSCLSREITENNNLVNLISKIVPNNDFNVTVASKKQNGSITKPKTSNITSKSVKENWDVTSMVSTCQDDNASETYTDEEIFNVNETKIDKRNKSVKKINVQQNAVINNNSGIKDQSKPNNQKKVTKTSPPKAKRRSNITSRKENECKYKEKNCIKKYVELFWDTDLDSEKEDINKRQKSRGILHNNFQDTNDVGTILKPAIIDSIEFAIEDSLKCKNNKEQNPKTIKVKQTNNKSKVLTNQENKHNDIIKEISKNVTTAETLLEQQKCTIKMRTQRHDPIEKEGNDSFGFLNFNLCKDRNRNREGVKITLSEPTRVLRSRNKTGNISQASFDVNMNSSTHSDRVLRPKRNSTVKKCCEETFQSTKSSPVPQLNRTLRSRVIDLSFTNSSRSKTVSSKKVKNKSKKS